MLRPTFERLFVVLLLLSSMNVLIALTPSSRESTKVKIFSAGVDRSSVAIEGGVYIYGAMLAVMRWRRLLRAARMVWPLLVLAALAFLSTTWSVQPMVTLRRSASLLAGTMVAVYLGERYSIETFARLLAQVLILMIVLVLVVYWLAPAYVIDYSAGGAWRGLSAYKNTFGQHMAIAVLILALVNFRRFNWIRYLFLVIAAGLLLLSRSANAVVCCALSLAAIPLWRLMRSRWRLLVYPLTALIFVVGISCVLLFPEALFQILGRDATLTGRTRLWTILLPAIASRPILGYGYAAFWAGFKPEVLSVWINAGRLVPVADNGYIDLCLSLGALGVCVFLAVLVRSFSRAVDYVRSEPGSIALWPVTYFCMFTVYNVCESTLLTTGTFPFLVFAILTTSLAVNHKRELAAARMVNNQPFTWDLTPPVISR